MDNELKTLCDLLNGYSDETRYQLVNAERLSNGKWNLIIEKCKKETTDDNN